VRLAVLVSGTGSVLEAMLEAGVPVSLVVADRSCRGLEVATKASVEPLLVARGSFGPDFDRPAYTRDVVGQLQDRHIDLIAMAGFGTVFSEPMQDAYGGRILNTHPALLPAFPGAHPVRDALAAGVSTTGATVHLVDAGVDTGPVLAQRPVPVLPGDDEDRLHERIKTVERELLVQTLAGLVAPAGAPPTTAVPTEAGTR
jgi:phosphoribosylglycinamide formyltransferase 1